MNKEGLELLKRFEGCHLSAYLCPAQKWTIGYGATFFEDGTKVMQWDRVSQEEADELLEYHLQHFKEDVLSVVTVPLNENQLSALISFTYNVGIGNLSKSTLLKKLNSGDYYGASLEFKRWNKAGGKVLRGLTIRRKKEQELFNKK